jgi:hypothetical protein
MRKRIKNQNSKAELVGKTIRNGEKYIKIATNEKSQKIEKL